jgi:hypothetical protein
MNTQERKVRATVPANLINFARFAVNATEAAIRERPDAVLQIV